MNHAIESESQKLQHEKIEQLQKQIDEIDDADSEENADSERLLETAALNENDFNKVIFIYEISQINFRK